MVRPKMKGFFKDPRLEDQPRQRDSGSTRDRKTREVKDPCEMCGLYKGVISPKMQPTGKGKRGWYVLAEAPGKKEDEDNYQLHKKGTSGKYFRDRLRPLGIDLDMDFIKDNVIRCRPPNNRKPSDTEITLCRKAFTTHYLRQYKPKKLFLLGGPAIKGFLGKRVKVEAVGKWVGWKIPDQVWQCWVYPMYHPSFAARDLTNKALQLKFKQVLREAVRHEEPFPDYGDERAKIVRITSPEDASSLLRRVIDEKPDSAIDFETSGIKPHASGHKVFTIGLSTDSNSGYAFPSFDNEEFLRLVKLFLTNPDIHKYAQALQMEQRWSRFILGYPIEGITWDTILATHTLDNRPGITSLKFQAYIRYGLAGYADEVDRYIPKNEKSANAFNRLHECPQDTLLVYQGLDAMLTYRLAKDQQRELRGGLSRGNELLREGSLALSDAEAEGLYLDVDYCREQSGLLTERLKQIGESIEASEEITKWNEKVGTKFNPNSDPQIKRLLYTILNYKPTKSTAKGNPSVDQYALAEIGTPFINQILRWRKLDKIKGTYLEGFLRETVDNIMRPTFPLHFVRTYRGSSRNPNFTNIPVRDEQAQRITRRAIKPHPGCQLMDVDYAKIEVIMAACNTHDPELIRYVSNPSTNMHRDEAMELFFLSLEQVTPQLYYAGKNQWVFPQFYGSYWAQCAPNLWRTAQREHLKDGTPVTEHLKTKGIKDYEDFEEHVEEREEYFWGTKFKAYAEWKEENWQRYQKNGYIDLLTGFRCSTLMGRNDTSNYPNQGPAFHCLLWSIIQLNKTRKKEGWRSGIVGQIHDDVVWNIHPNEKEYVKPIIRRVMCEDIRKEWKWIIVPLDIEAEVTEVDGNWYEKKKEPI